MTKICEPVGLQTEHWGLQAPWRMIWLRKDKDKSSASCLLREMTPFRVQQCYSRSCSTCFIFWHSEVNSNSKKFYSTKKIFVRTQFLNHRKARGQAVPDVRRPPSEPSSEAQDTFPELAGDCCWYSGQAEGKGPHSGMARR